MVGRFGGSSAGFVVAALNAASAAAREVVVRRVLSAGILCCYVVSLRLYFLKRKLGGRTKAGDMSALCQKVTWHPGGVFEVYHEACWRASTATCQRMPQLM